MCQAQLQSCPALAAHLLVVVSTQSRGESLHTQTLSSCSLSEQSQLHARSVCTVQQHCLYILQATRR